MKSGVCFYAVVAVINGASLHITFNNLWLLALGFILTKVVMGVLLILAVTKT